jgi:hypothetical protein
MKDDASRLVETVLRPIFPRTDAYRFNSASVRVRVIDDRFVGLADEERDALVEPLLQQLPQVVQDDIINLLTLTPEEANPAPFSRFSLSNLEFEDPGPSTLG